MCPHFEMDTGTCSHARPQAEQLAHRGRPHLVTVDSARLSADSTSHPPAAQPHRSQEAWKGPMQGCLKQNHTVGQRERISSQKDKTDRLSLQGEARQMGRAGESSTCQEATARSP